MLEKKTVIDQIEVAADNRVQIRFALLILEDGVAVSKTWHRTAIDPGTDTDAQIAAVNADITKREEFKARPVDNGRIQLLKAIVAAAHTPEVVAAWKKVEAAAKTE